MTRLAVIGARGYVGAEILALVARHPGLELVLATSPSAVGTPVRAVAPELASDLAFEASSPEEAAARDVDAVLLGVPNGEAARWAKAFEAAKKPPVVVDLSVDHRFDRAWVYGQPERRRAAIRGARRIANPGCYATAAQLAIDPFLGLAAGPFSVFGVSGFSGAGSTPSPRNDPDRLRDAILPYSLVDHTHEGELRHVLDADVDFLPHVAPFFRGLSVTVSFHLARPMTIAELVARLGGRYADEPFVRVVDEAPVARDPVGTSMIHVGGVEVSRDGRRAAVVGALDNLLAGAASQALRNLNLALGLDERQGVLR